MQLHLAYLSVVPYSLLIPVNSFVEPVSEGESKEHSDGKEGDYEPGDDQEYEEEEGHLRILPLYQILVLFEVVAVLVDDIECVGSPLFHVSIFVE